MIAAFLLLRAGAFAADVTFSRDVAPILYQRCLECHRSGEAAPMAFTTYKEVRPWAKAIKERVLTRAMPPWLADARHGDFRNDRRLPQREIDTIVAWVNAGAPEGDAKNLPPLPSFETGWNIGKPDMLFDIGADFDVPAEGVVPYKYFRVPTNLAEDKWVEAAEIRPDKRAVVHHVIVFVQDPGAPQEQRAEGANLWFTYTVPAPAVAARAGSL